MHKGVIVSMRAQVGEISKMVGKKGCVPIIDYKQKEKATRNFKEVVLRVSYIHKD
jgi:hypothetical protein